jgi:hypothetical protein
MVHKLAILALCLFFCPPSWAIPIRNTPRDTQGNVFPQGPSVAVVLDLPTASLLPPPGSTGSFYGTEKLLGPDGNPVKGSSVVENYKLVPGQSEDPDLGLALDFSTLDAPQPIRGTTSGGTDPGTPGMLLSSC